MLDFKNITYDIFKNQALRHFICYPYRSLDDYQKNLENVPKFIECNNCAEFSRAMEYLEKMLEEFKEYGNTSRYNSITSGISILAKCAVKSYIRINRSTILNDRIPNPKALILLSKLKKEWQVCSNDDLNTIAKITIVTVEEYMENSDVLSPFFKHLDKINNIKTDEVTLLHEISDLKLSTNPTKAQRIASNKGSFALYGGSYTINDILGSPTSFNWSSLLSDSKFVDNEKFINAIKSISYSDTAKIVFSRYVSRDDDFIENFPQFTKGLIAEFDDIDDPNNNQPGTSILVDHFNNNDGTATHARVMLHQLIKHYDGDTKSFTKKILILIRYALQNTPQGSYMDNKSVVYSEKNNHIYEDRYRATDIRATFDNQSAIMYLDNIISSIDSGKYDEDKCQLIYSIIDSAATMSKWFSSFLLTVTICVAKSLETGSIVSIH